MSQVYMIADMHFGHGQIICYENRPFHNTEEMNEYMIHKWNEIITKEDKVYILGDFSMLEAKENKKILELLNGSKILIMGNHDTHFSVKEWMEMGFDEVTSNPIIYKEWFILSHEPVYLNVNMPYANIFGHVHGNMQYRDYSKQSFCVSVERIGYQPILFQNMIDKMNAAT